MDKEKVATAEATTTKATAKIIDFPDISKGDGENLRSDSVFLDDNDSTSAPLLGEFAKSCAECFHFPIDMVEAVMIAVASTAIGDKIHVTSGIHNTNLSIWLCLVAPSGAGKTPLINEIMAPLKSIQSRRFENFKKEFDEYQSSRNRDKSMFILPVFQKTFVSDVTPEALYLDLSQNPNGLLMYRDELRGWIKDFGRYNSSGEIPNLLSIHSGDTICISRKTSPPIFVEHPFLSVLGGIQPRLLKKTFHEELIDSGFTGRMLFCFPNIEISTQMDDNVIPVYCHDFWSDFFNELPIFANPVSLTLTHEAREVKAEFYSANQIKMKKAEENEDAFGSAMYGKFINYADRLAGIIHIMRFYKRMPNLMSVNAETYQKAINLIAKFEQWGLKVRDVIDSPPKLPTQKEVIRLLNKVIPIVNQSKLAEALNKKQQYISSILKDDID